MTQNIYILFQGYLSEAGASMIDQKLNLKVVPKTAVGLYFHFKWSDLEHAFLILDAIFEESDYHQRYSTYFLF